MVQAANLSYTYMFCGIADSQVSSVHNSNSLYKFPPLCNHVRHLVGRHVCSIVVTLGNADNVGGVKFADIFPQLSCGKIRHARMLKNAPTSSILTEYMCVVLIQCSPAHRNEC